MKRFMKDLVCLAITVFGCLSLAAADELSLESAPAVVIKTVPPAGSTTVDPTLKEIRVIFSKPMQDGSWSWCTWSEESTLAITGKIHYLADGRTCVAPVTLKPGKFYATWLNTEQYQNFRDIKGQPAVPYLLTFETARAATGAAPSAGPSAALPAAASQPGLNERQRAFVDWTEHQFRSLFDLRTFAGWSEEQKADLEARSLDALKGPQNQEYYQAIGTLAALHSQQAVAPLLAMASERAEKDCRDRWMAVRALGMLGDKSVVPDLVHLVYHGNINTRWWAQVSLVRLTGQNFSHDWQAWGKWWNSQGGRPEFKAEFIAWYQDPTLSDPNRVSKTLSEADEKFFAELTK